MANVEQTLTNSIRDWLGKLSSPVVLTPPQQAELLRASELFITDMGDADVPIIRGKRNKKSLMERLVLLQECLRLATERIW